MSKLQLPMNEPRKRRSTGGLREAAEHRKRVRETAEEAQLRESGLPEGSTGGYAQSPDGNSSSVEAVEEKIPVDLPVPPLGSIIQQIVVYMGGTVEELSELDRRSPEEWLPHYECGTIQKSFPGFEISALETQKKVLVRSLRTAVGMGVEADEPATIATPEPQLFTYFNNCVLFAHAFKLPELVPFRICSAPSDIATASEVSDVRQTHRRVVLRGFMTTYLQPTASRADLDDCFNVDQLEEFMMVAHTRNFKVRALKMRAKRKALMTKFCESGPDIVGTDEGSTEADFKSEEFSNDLRLLLDNLRDVCRIE